MTIPTDKIAKLRDTLKILESILEKSLYVAGNDPTIADISMLSTFIMFQSTFKDYEDIPNINAWFERCQSLEGFEENVAGKIDKLFVDDFFLFDLFLLKEQTQSKSSWKQKECLQFQCLKFILCMIRTELLSTIGRIKRKFNFKT
jgi:Glutathione S-transferase, C-terminal domain